MFHDSDFYNVGIIGQVSLINFSDFKIVFLSISGNLPFSLFTIFIYLTNYNSLKVTLWLKMIV